MHYLDLPILVRNPSFEDIDKALNLLEPQKTSNFDKVDDLDKGTRQWLSRLSCHDLSHIPQLQAEELRDRAARRLALECCVTASANRTRTVTVGNKDIILHEPGMTEDLLGKMTWGSSLILSQRFSREPDLVADKFCIELGAGTGLCSITAALHGAKVHATDLPEIVENLRDNVVANNVKVDCYPLDWSQMPAPYGPEPFDTCIISDPVYSKDHPPLLLATVMWVNAPFVLLQLPLRRGFEAEREAIYTGLASKYKRVEYEEEEGRDQFGEQKFAFSKYILQN